MSSPIATAFVEIRGETSRFGPDVVDDVKKEMDRSGKVITDAVSKPINDAARTTRSIFADIGQSISNSIRPAVEQAKKFALEFKNGEGAASAFSGRMGAIGG